MHEIDPHSDSRLTEALRRLAASSREGAPAEVGAGLARAFQRHHTRRRRIRYGGVAALAACIVLVGGLLSKRSPHKVADNPQAHVSAGSAPITQSTRVAVTNTAATPLRPPAAKRARQKAAAISSTAARRQFLALPGYDPAVPADELHVVRVQLPASALWQMGAPVSPDSGGRTFMADFVISQDGTPYAVRLVQ
jgi:hypothetical protein